MEDNRITPTQQNSEDKLTLDEKMRDFGLKIKNAVPMIIAMLIAVWWVLYGMIEFVEVELSLMERTAMTVITIVFGYSYRRLIANGGYATAKQTKEWRQVTRDWNDAIKKGNFLKDEIKLYAKDIAIDNLKLIRKENMEANELNYYEYFDSDGTLINQNYRKDKTLTRKQKKIIFQCTNMRIVLPTLFGNLSNKFFGLKKEKNLNTRQKVEATRSLVITLVVSFLTAGMTVRYIGMSIEAVIYAFFQLTLWSAIAVVYRLDNFNFVIETLAPQIVEKTLIINGYLELDEKTKASYHKRINEIRGVVEEDVTENEPLIEEQTQEKENKNEERSEILLPRVE